MHERYIDGCIWNFQVESADLTAYGLIPEFVGRFPILVSLSALHEHELVKVQLFVHHLLPFCCFLSVTLIYFCLLGNWGTTVPDHDVFLRKSQTGNSLLIEVKVFYWAIKV